MNKSKLTEVSMIALSDYTLTIHAKKRQEERIDNLTYLGYSVGNPYKLFSSIGQYTPYNILNVCSLHEEEHICSP